MRVTIKTIIFVKYSNQDYIKSREIQTCYVNQLRDINFQDAFLYVSRRAALNNSERASITPCIVRNSLRRPEKKKRPTNSQAYDVISYVFYRVNSRQASSNIANALHARRSKSERTTSLISRLFRIAESCHNYGRRTFDSIRVPELYRERDYWFDA